MNWCLVSCGELRLNDDGLLASNVPSVKHEMGSKLWGAGRGDSRQFAPLWEVELDGVRGRG